MMFISVDLPEPDGPMIAVYSPRTDHQVDAAQRLDGLAAHAIATGEALGADQVGCSGNGIPADQTRGQ